MRADKTSRRTQLRRDFTPEQECLRSVNLSSPVETLQLELLFIIFFHISLSVVVTGPTLIQNNVEVVHVEGTVEGTVYSVGTL